MPGNNPSIGQHRKPLPPSPGAAPTWSPAAVPAGDKATELILKRLDHIEKVLLFIEKSISYKVAEASSDVLDRLDEGRS